MATDRNSYDTAASGEVQGTINQLSGQISSLIAQHKQNVAAALADADAGQVTQAYRDTEGRFNSAADSTLGIIKMLQDTLKANDSTAATTMKKAQAAVDNIGG
jgi:dihydroxyacetone kinase-like predicted kinase